MKNIFKQMTALVLAVMLVFTAGAYPFSVSANEAINQDNAATTEQNADQNSELIENGGTGSNLKNNQSNDADKAKEAEERALPKEATADDAIVLTQGETVIGSYPTFAKAIENIADYHYKNNKVEYVIKLQKDINEDIVIPAKKKIAIDLNGKKITNVKSHTIYNNSTNIRVKDSVGGGIVDNISHGKAAIYNNTNSNITLESGTFMRSAESSASDSVSGGNSYYVVKNYAAMTIKGSAVVKFSDTNTGLYSSLVANGWYDYNAAKEGRGNEPKPNGKKADLTISGGTLIGGQITVKNDDFGKLTISGGKIIQPNDNRYAVANNNITDIKGGSIEATGKGSIAVGSSYFAPSTNDGKLTIKGGTLKSSGTVIEAKKGSVLNVSGGTFETTGKDNFIFDVHKDANSAVNGGEYKGVAVDKVSNNKDAFAEGYGPVTDSDGNITVDVTEEGAVAIVRDRDGSAKRYASLGLALSNAKAGATVELQKNITLEKGVSTDRQPGITLDLNGYNIDGTNVKTAKGVVYMVAKYGWKPVEGVDSTMRVINSKETGGEIKGTLPLQFESGDGSYEIPGEIGEGVKLVALDTNADAVKLGSASYLVYSDKTKDYIKNGGFKSTSEDGVDYLFGSYAHAIKKASNGVVTLLHDYSGTEKIYSGSKSATLDLDGHSYTITGKTNAAIDVNYPNVELTIKNGKITANDNNAVGALLVGAPNKGQMNNRGLVLDNVELTVPGEVFGIVTNGTETGNKVVLKDSVLNVKEGYGIYFPSTGSVTIDNSIINAKHTGVQMCAGDLKVIGDKTEISVTGTPQEKTGGDGPIADGAAISVIERAGYKDLGKVNVDAGTFKSAEGVDAIKAYKFDNTNKEQTWNEAGDVVDVTGGSFTTVVPENLCGDKFVPTEIDKNTGLATVIKDVTAPVVTVNGNAVVDGSVFYGGELSFKVVEEHLDKVLVNDKEVKPNDEGVYTIAGEGNYKINVVDKANNEILLNIKLDGVKGKISAETATVVLGEQLVENGKEQTQTLTVTVDGVTLVEGIDYTVEGNKATKAGKYTLKVIGMGNYEGTLEVNYTVLKKGTPVTPSKPGESGGQGGAGTPSTGDNNVILPFALILLVSASAAACIFRYKRKSSK